MKKAQQKPRARSPQLQAQDLAAVRGGIHDTWWIVVGGGVGAADNGVIHTQD